MAQMAKLLSARQPVCTYQQSAYRMQLDALCNLAKFDRQLFQWYSFADRQYKIFSY